MSFQESVFYVLSVVLVLSALKVVTAKNPVHAALFLVLAFFTSAGLWLMLESEFLAISLVLVYVGAVMVLFLFVVMMLDINIEKLREGFWRNLPVAALVSIIMVVEMVLVLLNPKAGLEQHAPVAPLPADFSNIHQLGMQIYTTYLYPFELAAVLLLVAIVAAIALTMRKRKSSKYIDPAQQVKVRRADRVRMVSMPTEKRIDAPNVADQPPAA